MKDKYIIESAFHCNGSKTKTKETIYSYNTQSATIEAVRLVLGRHPGIEGVNEATVNVASGARAWTISVRENNPKPDAADVSKKMSILRLAEWCHDCCKGGCITADVTSGDKTILDNVQLMSVSYNMALDVFTLVYCKKDSMGYIREFESLDILHCSSDIGASAEESWKPYRSFHLTNVACKCTDKSITSVRNPIDAEEDNTYYFSVHININGLS